MSLRRPDQLGAVSSLLNTDILIAETNPFDDNNRQVSRISKGDLFSGFVNSAFNLGTGVGIYSNIGNNTVHFKSLLGGEGFVISSSNDYIYIDYTGAQESTSVSNIGAGVSLVSGIDDTDIKVKSLVGGDGLLISGSLDEIFLDYTGSSESTTISNIGSGAPIVSGVDGTDIKVKTLTGGDKFVISGSADEIFLDYTGIPESTTVSNIGSGLNLVSGIESFDIKVKSVSGGAGMAVREQENTVFIDFTGSQESTTASNIGSGVGLISGIDSFDVKLKSISGGENIQVSGSEETLFINFTGLAPGAGNGFAASGASFAFFSNIENNLGPVTKTYYNTPTANTHLSGITVDSAQDLKVYLRWDGPAHDYIGSGFINGTRIPDNQIIELGAYTRRFEGYLDNVSLVGSGFISGEANGSSALMPLSELGAGPTPTSLAINNISTATPKAGTDLGATHLKGGDSINIYAVFDTNDVDTIEIYNSGISDGVSASSYSLADTGDGNYTAIIPITVTNFRSNTQSISLIARNSFGTFGNATISSNSILLDQTYPSISASDPTSYNGRSDGLREGESTTFVNNINNWSSSIDTVLYSALSSDISISNTGTFESPKTVAYVDGIYNNSDNLRITASRNANGAIDTEDVKIKIANGPVITGVNLDSIASSASSPNIIGSSEVKGGDTLNAEVFIDGNGVSSNNISLSVINAGVSNGSQTSYNNYSVSTLSDGSFKYTIPVNVTSSTSRDGAQSVTVRARNNFGTLSDSFTSNASATVNNSIYPSISINSVSYPGGQEALKGSESATVVNTVSNYDLISYTSDNNQLSISNSTTFEGSKTVSRIGGNYNISTNNFKITATKSSNGRVVSDSDIVNIASAALSLSITNLSNSLSSSPAGTSDTFNLISNQKFLSAPTLSLDSSQTSPSSLSVVSSGNNTNSNSYRITVSDSDTKGTFTWGISATNLAGISTTSIATNPNYTIAGFSSRTITASPNSLGAGLANIGTTVSNPSSVVFENLSEGGAAPNGGTIYTIQTTGNGIQMSNALDINNKFVITDSSGLTDSNGDHVFNLDKLNRAANTSVSNPASFVISES